MKRFLVHISCLVVLATLLVTTAFAGGYQLNEHGARAVGMGGAFVARASDASAVYFNPAGLGFQQGINLLGGGTFILPSTKFTYRPTGAETKASSLVFFPPNLYGTYAVDDQMVLGLGVFTPYGLGTEWPNDNSWPGRYLAVKTDLQTFYVNPSIGYKISDDLSVGFGLSYVYGSVTMSRKVGPIYRTLVTVAPGVYAPVPSSAADGSVKLDATASGFGFNFGVIYKPMPELSLGASFRSETKLDFSGTATFSDMGDMGQFTPGGDGKATLPMPMNIYVGAAYQVMPELTVEADFQYVGWSAYDKLTLDLPVGPTANLVVSAGPPPVIVQKVLQGPSTDYKNWDDGYLGRVGAEYKYDDQLTLRAGLIMDISPQPPVKTEPMLPDGDRTDLSVGGSYKIDQNLHVDLAYMIVLFAERATNNPSLPGTYNSIANLISVDIGYSF